MNFKIENTILNITNYPSVERHLEDMAARGWLLDRIIWSHIFIYKRIEPRQLDFSIYPYKNESFFNKMSKEDLDQIKDKNESLGWTYSAKANYFQVYFKEEGLEAEDMIANERREMDILENIAETLKASNYLSFITFLILFWLVSRDGINSIEFLKSGLSQFFILVLPFIAIATIIDLVAMNKFLKKNKENIDEGRSIEYKSSKYTLNKISFILAYLLVFIAVGDFAYTIISSQSSYMLVSILPLVLGLLVGLGLRFFVKPSKKLQDYKAFIFIGAIIVVIVLINLVMPSLLDYSMDDRWKQAEEVDTGEDRVLSVEDFIGESEKNQARILRSISFLVPKSYEYTNREYSQDYYTYDSVYIRTEYLFALTEGLAKRTVDRYKEETEKDLDQGADYVLENYYYDRAYVDRLDDFGITRAELSEIKGNDLEVYKENAKDLIKERAIVEADNKLWNVDEAYFLDSKKDLIILRKNKEVYILYGVDFSDDENRKITVDKLGF